MLNQLGGKSNFTWMCIAALQPGKRMVVLHVDQSRDFVVERMGTCLVFTPQELPKDQVFIDGPMEGAYRKPPFPPAPLFG